jgi:steroid delta-isomerase
MDASRVARNAMAAVQEQRREDWLALFTDDAHVEDPVGHLPAIVGKTALAQFWDQAIVSLDAVTFDVTRRWETSAETMLLATVSLVTADGARVTYDGTFDYALDETGRIASIRAFWDLPAVVTALTSQTAGRTRHPPRRFPTGSESPTGQRGLWAVAARTADGVDHDRGSGRPPHVAGPATAPGWSSRPSCGGSAATGSPRRCSAARRRGPVRRGSGRSGGRHARRR